jgi:hypothetical protein
VGWHAFAALLAPRDTGSVGKGRESMALISMAFPMRDSVTTNPAPAVKEKIEEVEYKSERVDAFDGAISGKVTISTSATNSHYGATYPGITFTYQGKNAGDVDFIQFFQLGTWIVRTQPGGEPTASAGTGFALRPDGGEHLDYSSGDSPKYYLDCKPKENQVEDNANRKDKRPLSPYYVASGGSGEHVGDKAEMFDAPSLNRQMLWELIRQYSSGGDNADPTVTKLKAYINFTTFVLYKDQPFYRITWAVTSYWIKAKDEPDDKTVRWSHTVNDAPFVFTAGTDLGNVKDYVKALDEQSTQEFKGKLKAP